MLEFRLFGPGQATYGGRLLAGFPSQQSHLLLCYLLLNPGRPHHRERLAAVFWADYPRSESRKHLSKALWRLRHGLGAAGVPCDRYLCVDKECVALAASSPYWLDVDAFEAKIVPVQPLPARGLSPLQVAALEQAVDLYAGDLLEGVYEDWCLHDRERLGLLYANALYKLMIFHEQGGSYECGLAYGERLLARDNANERVNRQMMRLYWLAGDRGTALAQYKVLVQLLRDEFGLEPMPATRRLYEEMRHNQFQPAPQVAPYPAPAGPNGSLPPVAKQALHRLAQLQEITRETERELQHLKQLIAAALDTPDHSWPARLVRDSPPNGDGRSQIQAARDRNSLAER